MYVLKIKYTFVHSKFSEYYGKHSITATAFTSRNTAI